MIPLADRVHLSYANSRISIKTNNNAIYTPTKYAQALPPLMFQIILEA